MRLPRPCRLRLVSVRSASEQIGVSEATAHCLCHRKGEAVFVGEGIILRRAIVIAKHLLRNVAVKVEWLNGNIGATQSAFKQTPEILYSLSMDLPANVFAHVVHGICTKSILRSG